MHHLYYLYSKISCNSVEVCNWRCNRFQKVFYKDHWTSKHSLIEFRVYFTVVDYNRLSRWPTSKKILKLWNDITRGWNIKLWWIIWEINDVVTSSRSLSEICSKHVSKTKNFGNYALQIKSTTDPLYNTQKSTFEMDHHIHIFTHQPLY